MIGSPTEVPKLDFEGGGGSSSTGTGLIIIDLIANSESVFNNLPTALRIFVLSSL